MNKSPIIRLSRWRRVHTRSCSRTHTAAHTIECHWAGGSCQEGNSRGNKYYPPPPPPRLLPWRALPSLPGSRLARLLGRPGGLGGRGRGGVGPSPTGGPFRARDGAQRGTSAPAAPGAKARGLAAGGHRVVNDLITRLGRWGCCRPSLAPPPPWRALGRRVQNCPLPLVRPGPPAGGRGAGRTGREPGVGAGGLSWAGFLGEDGAGGV